MKYTIAAAFGAIVLGAAIASCGNNGNLATAASTPTPAATPSTPCTSPPNTQVQVVYPQPNASGVSTGTIVVAVAPTALPSNSNLYVRVANTSSGSTLGYAYGTTLTVIPFAQVPQPSLNPPFAFPIYESSNFGGLFGTGDTFRVFLANSLCYPGVDLQSQFST
jgi:hypothetical protein